MFFGKVRPKLFYLEPNASLDLNIGNTSISPMLNLFLSYYLPLLRQDKDHWFAMGLRSGVAYGYVIADTDSGESREAIAKLFKSEIVIGRYSIRAESVISIGLGISPVIYRQRERSNNASPHISVNLSYLITGKNGQNIFRKGRKN